MNKIEYFNSTNKDMELTEDELNWFKFEFNSLGGLYKLTHPYKKECGYDSDIDQEGDCILCGYHSYSTKACVSSRKDGILSVCNECYIKYNFVIYNC